MKLHQGIAALAIAGLVSMGSYAQACDGSGKGKSATKASMGAGCSQGASAQTAGGSCCSGMKSAQGKGACTGKDASMCKMSSAECEKMMRTYYQTHGWLGIEANCCPGMTAQPAVLKIAQGSPAEQAGFKVGDTLTSINGIAYSAENEATIQSLMTNGFKVGDTVRYTAMRDGKIVNIQAKLVKISDPALMQMVAAHVASSHANSDKAEKSM